ncbi:MAG: hypothetical protein EU530_08875 [Promethearchaeota archaeon]|nr:MAG: hypothetical protein EU530_08875 [Candidatus Lokiarchaeota archaeon]
MGKKHEKERKHRYPRKVFVPLYWVAVGIAFLVIMIMSFIDWAFLTWLLIWTPFMIGAILYSIYFQRQGVRICANCGKYAYRGRKYCEKCGARIFWHCPKCDGRINRYLKFCKECGQSLKVVTFSRQLEFDEAPKLSEEELMDKESNIVVTGSVVQFCPSCGAEITEDLTHCSICGSKFDR